MYNSSRREGYTQIRFVVVAFGRSGSTLLVDLLRCHPETVCYHEPFHMKNPHRPLKNEQDTIELAKEIYEIGIEGGPRKQGKPSLHNGRSNAVGFKMTIAQLLTDIPGLVTWFRREPNLKVVLLDRRNTLRRYLSYELAKKRGLWHSPKPQKSGNLKYTVDPVEFRKFIDLKRGQKNDFMKVLSKTNHSVLEIYYEGLVDERDKTLDRITDFLGLQSHGNYTSATVKLVEGELDDIVSNYNEIVRLFPNEIEDAEALHETNTRRR